MRGRRALTTGRGPGCGLAASLPSEFGEAQGAGGPLGGPPGPSLRGWGDSPVVWVYALATFVIFCILMT